MEDQGKLINANFKKAGEEEEEGKEARGWGRANRAPKLCCTLSSFLCMIVCRACTVCFP